MRRLASIAPAADSSRRDEFLRLSVLNYRTLTSFFLLFPPPPPPPIILLPLLLLLLLAISLVSTTIYYLYTVSPLLISLIYCHSDLLCNCSANTVIYPVFYSRLSPFIFLLLLLLLPLLLLLLLLFLPSHTHIYKCVIVYCIFVTILSYLLGFLLSGGDCVARIVSDVIGHVADASTSPR